MASALVPLLLLLLVLAGTMVTVRCQVTCAMALYSCSSALSSSTGGTSSLKKICQATEGALSCLENVSSRCGSSLGSSFASQVAKLRKERGCGGAGDVSVSVLTTVLALLASSLLRP